MPYSPAEIQGGIGFVITEDEDIRTGKMYRTVPIGRMEQMAAIDALDSIKEPSEITIVTRFYVCVELLLKGGREKANTDLWERLDKAVNRHKVVSVEVGVRSRK